MPLKDTLGFFICIIFKESYKYFISSQPYIFLFSTSKVKIPFALNLSLTQDSLENTLDYSHHNTSNMKPAGATVGDEADNSRAKVCEQVM